MERKKCVLPGEVCIPELNMVTFQLSEFQGLAKDRIIVLCSEGADDFPDEDEFPVDD